jgi:hypothetical protein
LSGNLLTTAAEVSGKWTKSLVFQPSMSKSTRGLELPVILSIYWKPARNLCGPFPEVSGQSVIDGPHYMYCFTKVL